ncbi:sugar phosphate isomerase/epimerase family protein [Anaeromicropila populeti]|uniref:Sugar phosphate isomerase/epimerase n=1 Tax=Anaeromicropila populeti TaxID=37658 RepID=A0A1I6I9F2_9FIRM|nr:sugar phosphate isomerase/epimerase family protein [Anaeromicropila populeti]SFR63333.1 Sugar phosphate isomerase/epimerase [Anaeromicropila populeti]
MQIGIRLHDTINLPLEERLAVVKEQKFQCAHLALSKVIKEYSVANEALTPGFAMYLKKLFNQYEIDIAVLGCYLNLANPNADKLEKIKETYMANIRFASILGCGVVGTETGAPNEAYQYEPACRSEEALNFFIDNLSTVVAYAESMGVVVAIEPVWKHIVYNPLRAKEVLDRIQSPNLQIILDPVNLLGIENYMNQQEVIAEAIEVLGDYVSVVHIKDFIVDNRELVSVAAGTGLMKYDKIIEFIKKKKPHIHVTLENTVPANAVEARKYIQRLWNECCE